MKKYHKTVPQECLDFIKEEAELYSAVVKVDGWLAAVP